MTRLIRLLRNLADRIDSFADRTAIFRAERDLRLGRTRPADEVLPELRRGVPTADRGDTLDWDWDDETNWGERGSL